MKKFIILGLSMIFVLAGCSLSQSNNQTPVEVLDEESEANEQIIGGQRDEYGCLGPAGYTWDEEAGACLREWEIQGEEARKAIKIAVDYLQWGGDATVIEVTQARCPGCYTVKLEKNTTQDRKTVNLENWEVTEVSMTPDECLDLGGRLVNTVGGETCSDSEKNIGQVTGFISPNICCVSEN